MIQQILVAGLSLIPDGLRAPSPGLCVAIGLLVTGCAAPFSPTAVHDVPFEPRAQTEVQGGLTVRAAVPTRDEATAIYGVDLASKGMQPVWIEVKNDERVAYWLLASGLDPAYFSAAEAAYPFRSAASADRGRVIDEHFQSLEFKNPVPPGATVSGFVIVNRDEAFKAVDVDLVGQERAKSFTYIIVDPSFKGDFTLVDFDTLYESSEIINIEEEGALHLERQEETHRERRVGNVPLPFEQPRHVPEP